MTADDLRALAAVKVRPDVLAFALAMEANLRANDRKGTWKRCRIGYLRRRLRTEMRELMAALDDLRNTARAGLATGDAEERVLDEAADVANFCMMIADVSHALFKEPTP